MEVLVRGCDIVELEVETRLLGEIHVSQPEQTHGGIEAMALGLDAVSVRLACNKQALLHRNQFWHLEGGAEFNWHTCRYQVHLLLQSNSFYQFNTGLT